MNLNSTEKRILNAVFKDVTGTTRDTMLLALFAAKPAKDGSGDANEIITAINGLIVKIYNAEPPEMEEVFAGIPYEI